MFCPKKMEMPIGMSDKENNESNTESNESEDEKDSGNGWECPYCGKVQDEYIYNPEKRGWARCPSCGKHSREKDIPDEYVTVVEPEEEEEEEEEDDEEEEWVEEDEYEPRSRRSTRRRRPGDRRDTSRRGRYIDEEEGGDMPFREPKSDVDILEEILNQFAVKSKPKDIILSRCRRAGEMHPSELGNLLAKLDSGVSMKSIPIVTEEYEIALKAAADEEELMEQYGLGGSRRSGLRSSRTSSRHGGSRLGRSRSEIRGKYADRDVFTAEDVADLLDQQEHRFDRMLQEQKRRDEMQQMREAMKDMMEEIRMLREDPPGGDYPPDMVTVSDLMEIMSEQNQNKSEDMLKMMLQREKENAERLREERIREQKEYRQELREIRNMFTQELREKDRDIKDAQRRLEDLRSQPKGEYQDDSLRMASDVGKELVRAIDSKQPVKEIGRLLEKVVTTQAIPQQPPPEAGARERGEPSSVADLLSDEYVE